jgi:hypothetical protein
MDCTAGRLLLFLFYLHLIPSVNPQIINKLNTSRHLLQINEMSDMVPIKIDC